ncbi:MAG: phosphoribosyltransferase, partial [Crocinitomicaceae bacterium]
MEKQVALHDKKFSLYLEEEIILNRVKELAISLSQDYNQKELVLLCILNGAFMFASDLAKNFNGPVEVSFVKVRSYVGTESTGKVDELIGLTANLKN